MGDILIVDDERDIRELIGDILRDEGYSVRLAGTSEECVTELGRELPSLMILDIWLKDSKLDGIDILKKVKRETPEVPVIIISTATSRSRWPPSSRAPTTSSRSPSTSTSSWS